MVLAVLGRVALLLDRLAQLLGRVVQAEQHQLQFDHVRAGRGSEHQLAREHLAGNELNLQTLTP